MIGRFFKVQLIMTTLLGLQKTIKENNLHQASVCLALKGVYQIKRLRLIIFMNYSGEKKIFLKTHRRIKTDINSNNNSQFRSSEITAGRNRKIINQSERYKT